MTSARLRAASVLAMATLLLAGCATAAGGAATPTSSAPASSPSPSASETVQTPTPLPTDTPTSDLPFNGEVLIITAEVNAGKLEVTAMVPDVVEDGGTCALSIEGGSATATVAGVAGNGVTYCGLMSLATGADASVRFRVTYTSSSTRAQSALSTVESGQ